MQNIQKKKTKEKLQSYSNPYSKVLAQDTHTDQLNRSEQLIYKWMPTATGNRLSITVPNALSEEMQSFKHILLQQLGIYLQRNKAGPILNPNMQSINSKCMKDPHRKADL